MKEFNIETITKVKFSKKAIKKLQKGKKISFWGHSITGINSITVEIKPTKSRFEIKAEVTDCDEILTFEATLIEEVVDLVQEIYGTGLYFA